MVKIALTIFISGWILTQLYGCAGCSIGSEGHYAAYVDTAYPETSGKVRFYQDQEMAATARDKVVVKMRKEKGIYKIPVGINGVVMDFFFDTGAGMISISEVGAAFLLKQGKVTPEDFSGRATFTNANGEKSEFAVVKLKDVSIGSITLHNIEASIVNNSQAPLLLGQSFLEQFGKVSIDYKAGEISFE